MDTCTSIFWNEGHVYTKGDPEISGLTLHRKFISFYGVGPEVCTVIWKSIASKPSGSQYKHLLWCLLFLKRYSTEHVNSALVGADEKTFRTWTWVFIELISKLPVIKWENRFHNPEYPDMYVTLDGTDCPISEPTVFDPKWYSHKLNGPGVRYEIGISIGSGDIVWASGGLPCGDWPDLKIAKDLYIFYTENEVTLADKGYNSKQYFRQPRNRIEKALLARHETLNGRLKQFQILNVRFRNELKKHPMVFHACVNILQICIQNGAALFEVS